MCSVALGLARLGEEERYYPLVDMFGLHCRLGMNSSSFFASYFSPQQRPRATEYYEKPTTGKNLNATS